jgi:aspartate oxidase
MGKARNDFYEEIDENSLNDLLEKKEEIKKIMSKSCFVVRNMDELEDAYSRIKIICEDIDKLNLTNVNEIEVANMALVAKEILRGAIKRTESLGTHYIAN